jgi:dTDP-glucose pyrophosphorylase
VYIKQVDVHKQHELKLTSSQKSMIARHAKNLRVTANARAKYLSTHYLELASACEGAIIKNKQQLVKIKAEIVAGSNNAFLRPEALKKKTQQITKLRFLIHQMSNRLQRLKAAAEKSSQLSERGLATMCLGGKKTGLCCA